MQELFFKLNCHFTDADKEECKSTIYKMVELANLARKNGVLALELEIEQEQSFFLKTAINLVVDGIDPVLVKQILQNIILADKYFGSQLLNRLIMAEGVLALQQGEAPLFIALKLSSMLGEKYILPINESLLANGDGMTSFYHFLKTLKDKKPLSESARFESKFLQLPDRSIQLILHGIDSQKLLSALHGCGINLIQKISMNISKNTCLKISKEWDLVNPLNKESILASQEEILKKIEALESRGEIVSTTWNFSGDMIRTISDI